MIRRTRQSGYVLLLVMLVLTIAATALMATTRACLARAVGANHAQRDLQVRWGALSCESLLLPVAEDILADADADADVRGEHPSSAIHHEIVLGKMTFHLIVSDEQAKLSLTHLAAGNHAVRFVRAIRDAQQGLPAPLTVDLADVGLALSSANSVGPLQTFEQIFNIDHPSQMITVADLPDSPTGRIGLIGDGAINFTRAHPAVLAARLKDVISHGLAAELLSLIERSPATTLNDLIAELDLSQEDARPIREALTDTSNCHSLWVVVDDGVRQFHRLSVLSGSNDWRTTVW